MMRYITCQSPDRFVRVAWLSLQANGDVSFGLNDKTYVSPDFRTRKFIWNAYNRITAEYSVSSDPAALQKVKNPHFTFHKPHYFHLKETKAKGDNALFAGIADVNITIEQQGEMPWIRATTAPLSTLKSAGLTWGKIPTNDLPLKNDSDNLSLQIGIDFVRPGTVGTIAAPTTWFIKHAEYSYRVTAHFVAPQIATLAWFHSS